MEGIIIKYMYRVSDCGYHTAVSPKNVRVPEACEGIATRLSRISG